MQKLTTAELQKIHDASMELLRDVGICMHEPEAIEIFKKHGIKVDGNVAFLNEEAVSKALETTPPKFTVTARNHAKSVNIGGEGFVFAPGYGTAFVASNTGERRYGSMRDYDNFCKLVQTSKYIDMNGFLMIEPYDVPRATAYLDMLCSNILLCDKAFMGSPLHREAARDSIEMAAILWGGEDRIKDKPVMLSNINTLSPLQYSSDMAGALIEFVRWGQPVIIAVAIMAGATGPITLAGVLTLLNAEILAGVVLSQLINPGAPVVYGVISCPMDMRTASLAFGAPEMSMLVSAGAQLARFYKLPSRGGGALTEAHLPDMQAGIESAIGLTSAIRSGINFMFLACGILGTTMSISFEKFLIDEELCGMVRKLQSPIKVTDETIDLKTIKECGIGGEYITHPKTLEGCRTEFFLPDLFNRQNYDEWKNSGSKRVDQSATDVLQKRLAAYEQPKIDEEVETALRKYITQRKKNVR